MYSRTIIASLIIMSVGCSQEEYSECASPRNELKIMFKPKYEAHPFSHSFCIVCNPLLEESEYEQWAVDMGAPQGPSNPENVHPCLYVYTGNNTDIDSLAQCESLVCDGNAVYNDMVGKENGNFNLDPILNP